MNWTTGFFSFLEREKLEVLLSALKVVHSNDQTVCPSVQTVCPNVIMKNLRRNDCARIKINERMKTGHF